MDWHGFGYKWYCPDCGRGGNWTSQPEAIASGHGHAKDKHGLLVVEWTTIGFDEMPV